MKGSIMDKIMELKYILKDLVLWNNKYNSEFCLNISVQPDTVCDGIVDANNEYWNRESKDKLSLFCSMESLMNE
jgi:hypothetical protein